MPRSQQSTGLHYKWNRPRGRARLSPLKLDAYVMLVEAAARGAGLDHDSICAGLPEPAKTPARKRAVGRALDDLCRRGLLVKAAKAAAAVRPEQTFGLTGAGCAAAKSGQFNDLNPDEILVLQVLLAPASQPCSRRLFPEQIAAEAQIDAEHVDRAIETLSHSGWIA